MYSKKCPKCEKEMFYKSKQSLLNSYTLQSKCNKCRDYKGRKYNFNINIFNRIDNIDKAYWLGFIFGDGHVTNYGLMVELSQKDKEHLSKLSNFMSYTGPIKNTRKNCCAVHMCSKILSQDLLQYNLQPPKILTIPNLNSELLSHFYRGFFDADGWITEHKHKKCQSGYEYGFCCSNKQFLTNIQDYFIHKLGRKCGYLTLHKNPLGSVYQLIIGGNTLFKQLSEILYKDANYYLDRKYNLMKSAITDLNNR